MDKSDLYEVIPHYLAMLLIVFLAINVISMTVGEQSFWVEMGIVVVIVFLYRPVVQQLGIAPSAWER